jgi:hypothetical protein
MQRKAISLPDDLAESDSDQKELSKEQAKKIAQSLL